jgi:hypothetical protein
LYQRAVLGQKPELMKISPPQKASICGRDKGRDLRHGRAADRKTDHGRSPEVMGREVADAGAIRELAL